MTLALSCTALLQSPCVARPWRRTRSHSDVRCLGTSGWHVVEPLVHDEPTFQPLTEEAYNTLFGDDSAGAMPASMISIVAYQAKWDRRYHDVGPILAAASQRWRDVRFFSTELVRGTPSGERIFASLQAQGFDQRQLPIVDVYCGGERIDTLVLTQGEGGGEGAECPLFTQRWRMEMLQKTIASAQGRLSTNRRWRERRRVLLALRRVRHDLRRLDRFKGEGLLSRTWSLTKETNTMYRDPSRRAFSPEKMRRERRKHLLGVLGHARQVATLQAEQTRLERRRRHLANLVLARQRCDADGCALLDEHGKATKHDGEQLVSIGERFADYLSREQQHCDKEGCVM